MLVFRTVGSSVMHILFYFMTSEIIVNITGDGKILIDGETNTTFICDVTMGSAAQTDVTFKWLLNDREVNPRTGNGRVEIESAEVMVEGQANSTLKFSPVDRLDDGEWKFTIY